MLLKKLFYPIVYHMKDEHMERYWQLFVYQSNSFMGSILPLQKTVPTQNKKHTLFDFCGTKPFSKALAKILFFVVKTMQLKIETIGHQFDPFFGQTLKK